MNEMTAGEVDEFDECFEDLDLTGCICPRCGVGEGLREILYGLPAGPPDESKYIIGGCCVDESSPEIGCVMCGWEGGSSFLSPGPPSPQLPPYTKSK